MRAGADATHSDPAPPPPNTLYIMRHLHSSGPANSEEANSEDPVHPLKPCPSIVLRRLPANAQANTCHHFGFNRLFISGFTPIAMQGVLPRGKVILNSTSNPSSCHVFPVTHINSSARDIGTQRTRGHASRSWTHVASTAGPLVPPPYSLPTPHLMREFWQYRNPRSTVPPRLGAVHPDAAKAVAAPRRSWRRSPPLSSIRSGGIHS